MKPLILVCLLVCACAAAPPATKPADAGTNTAEAWLEKIERRAADIETLQAKLRYDRIQGLLGDEQRRLGTLAYDAGPPPRFRANFHKRIVNRRGDHIDRTWIFDGHWLAERNGDDKTFIRWELVAADEQAKDLLDLGEGPFALPLNMQKDAVLRRFDVTLIPEDDVHLRLVPKDGMDIEQTQIDLWYDRETLLPTRCATMDDSENESIVELSDVVVNEELNDVSFDTSPPKGRGWTVDEHPLEE